MGNSAIALIFILGTHALSAAMYFGIEPGIVKHFEEKVSESEDFFEIYQANTNSPQREPMLKKARQIYGGFQVLKEHLKQSGADDLQKKWFLIRSKSDRSLKTIEAILNHDTAIRIPEAQRDNLSKLKSALTHVTLSTHSITAISQLKELESQFKVFSELANLNRFWDQAYIEPSQLLAIEELLSIFKIMIQIETRLLAEGQNTHLLKAFLEFYSNGKLRLNILYAGDRELVENWIEQSGLLRYIAPGLSVESYKLVLHR